MIICGYLFTKEFSVVLDNIDSIATVRYDLNNNDISVIGVPNNAYKIFKNK